MAETANRAPAGGLDAAAVLAALAGLYAGDGVAERAAHRALQQLTTAADWQGRVAELERGGVSARWIRGSLAEVFSEPGEIALVRRPAGDYLLLHRLEPHWRLISAEGDATELDTQSGGDALVLEAVLLRLPHAKDEAVTALAQLWPLLRGAWMEVGLASLFINGCMLLTPLFALLVYDKVVTNGVFETLWALVIGMTIYLLLDSGMRLVRSWSIERIAADLSERSDERLWHRLLAQKDFAGGGFASFLAEYRTLAASRDFVSAHYLMGLADLPFFTLYLIVIGIIAWPILVLLLVLALGYALTSFALQARTNRLGKEAEQVGTRKLAMMSETLNALDVVRSAPASHLLLRRWRSLTADTADLEAKRRLTGNYSHTLSAGMTTLTTVAVLTVGAYLIDARLLTVGGLIATNMLAARAMSQVASLFSLFGKWHDFRRATERLEASLEPLPEPAHLEKPRSQGRIEVVGVSREFKGRPVALDQVSCTLAPGERVALLGRPGSGKTTLLRCIAGLSRPDRGQILIDGVDLADIARSDRNRWLAYKAQEPALFAGTLDENLRIAGCSTESPRYAQALWASGLEEELARGRMTLGMLLAERGANLSGGQRQKVALARAFAQSARILLLDEPTLGLDPDGERLLAERLPKIVGDGTLLVSTHSVIVLGILNRVIAIDGGKIVADGPKERLLRAAPPPAA